MKIKRGNQEFELTEAELYEAYKEQRLLFAIEDVEEYSEEELSERELQLAAQEFLSISDEDLANASWIEDRVDHAIERIRKYQAYREGVQR